MVVTVGKAWNARRTRTKGRSIATAAAVLLASTVLAACESDDGDEKTEDAATGEVVTVEVSRERVAQLTDPESELFEYSSFIPTEPVEPKSGARIAVVAAALSSPVVKQYAGSVVDAAEVAGFEPATFDGKFQVETQSSLIQQAVQQKFDGIVLVGIVPDTMVSPLAAAKDAKIPVISYDGYGDEDNGVTDIGIDPAAAGEAVANWIIADSDGKAKVLAVTFPPGVSGGAKSITQAGQEALIDALKRCEECTVETEDIALSEVVTPGSPVYVDTLRKYRKGSVDYVASGCDVCMVTFAQLNTQLGRNELKVTGGIAVGGTGLAEIASGDNNAVVAPVQPDSMIALLAIDALARRLDGQTVENMTKLPEPLVSAVNADKFPGATFVPPVDYEESFRELWGR